ncbi:uncharacterized protein LOC131693465 [Topomyia yanbarensis]|uniref:uncharacterized protein LOC131693465 n=1 Tax=Topomyia yanbarensis TaxID=2498891 RepID=UPI00273AC1BF|nr:uncharacterized protein LOC131693465 [Topomyia yanbarensis]
MKQLITSMKREVLVIFIYAVSVHWTSAENLLTNQELMNSYMFPTRVTVAVGESVHLKILAPMTDDDRCLYREPGSAEDIDIHAPARFHQETRVALQNTSKYFTPRNVDANECGIKVLKISHQDAGFWRLTMIRGATIVMRGIAMVNVIDIPTVPDPGDRDSIAGLEEITPDGTDYCYVLRNTESQNWDVPMYESCSLAANEMDPTGSGHWNVIAGVQGYMREMHFAINIEHKEEQIVTSINRAADFEVLMCHLRYSQHMIKFCRFIRLADSLGLNVLEGVGWDRYRYNGNGFAAGDCGLEIEEPAAIDRGLWKCVVGYGDDKVVKVSGAIMDNSESEAGLQIIAVENVNALNGTEMALQCNANKPLDYCWFKDPAGMNYSVSESLVQDGNTSYWYSGISLAMGDCGIKLTNITMEMAGQWSCHVGSSKFSALEVSEFINVRISQSQMIGSVSSVEATLETALILECSSIPKSTPLQYCRFVTPSGQAFSLDQSVTSDKAILDKYYSNPNHDPKSGFCSLVVKSISTSDLGQWICAGKIAGHTMEHYATIEVTSEQNSETTELTVASIVGMALGGVAIVVIAVALGIYNYRRRLHRQATAINQEIELQERNLEARAQSEQRFSIASRSSGNSQESQRSDNQLRDT